MAGWSSVLGDRLAPDFEGSRVDQPIGRVARKRRGERDGGRSDRRADVDGADLFRQLIEPTAERDGKDDALVARKPGQLVPGDRGYQQFAGPLDQLLAGLTQAFGLGRPPSERR